MTDTNGQRSAVRAMLVVVPARSEAERIARCLTSILTAADRVPPTTIVRVILAADGCRDNTAEIARRVAQRAPRPDRRLIVLEGDWGTAGRARGVGTSGGLERIRALGIDRHHTWITTTDADTVVPPDWLLRQLDEARAGADAVAGIVELHPDRDLTAEVAAVFRRTYPLGVDTHRHVHAANLGIRADAYIAAGGFADMAVGEDHALWQRLRALGFHCRSSIAVRVSTSARLQGRAPGGFADTLQARLVASRPENPGTRETPTTREALA